MVGIVLLALDTDRVTQDTHKHFKLQKQIKGSDLCPNVTQADIDCHKLHLSGSVGNLIPEHQT